MLLYILQRRYKQNKTNVAYYFVKEIKTKQNKGFLVFCEGYKQNKKRLVNIL